MESMNFIGPQIKLHKWTSTTVCTIYKEAMAKLALPLAHFHF